MPVKFFPRVPGHENPVARIRFVLLAAVCFVLIVLIGIFLVFNIVTGNRGFIPENVFLLSLSSFTIFLLHKGYHKAAVYSGFIAYGLQLIGFILYVKLSDPLYLSQYSYNLLLILALVFILSSSIICTGYAQQAIIITASSAAVLVDYCTTGLIFFLPSALSLAGMIILTGAVSILFMRGSRMIESLIREKNRLLNDLSEKNEEAIRELNARSGFIAAVSHDIRTPLFSLTGFSELLADTRLDEEQREYLKGITTGSSVLLELVEGLLNLSRMESEVSRAEGEAVSLRDIFYELSVLFSPASAEKGVELAYTMDESLPRQFSGDSTLVRQILLNLVSNALKFTHTGSVRVKAERGEEGGVPLLVLTVSDTGPGIPADRIGQIFDPFVKFDNGTRTSGAGLGLAITRRAVLSMNGTITVESEPGRGTVFTVTIPLMAAQPDVQKVPPVQDTGMTLEGTSVLLAEDDATNRFLMTRLLEKIGVTPVTAANGREAVEKYTAGSFNVVLLDIGMSDMDGIEAATAIRELSVSRNTPVSIIAVTADIYFKADDTHRPPIFDGIITKPFTIEALRRALVSQADSANRI